MSEATVAEHQEEIRSTEFMIVVNGERAVVPNEIVSYAEVVAIAYPVPPGPDTTYTVTFRNAKGPRHEGILVEGETVEVKKEGTTFDVVPTGKS
jgi:hypothetical protein